MNTYLTSTRLLRRDLLKGGLALGATLPFVGMSLGQDAGTPTPGGVLVANMPNDLPNYDPIANNTGRVLAVIGGCYNALVQYHPFDQNKVVPDLAETWEISEDGTEYTFHIVQNARFSDGSPLTTADVKATFDRVRNPPEGVVSIRRGLLSQVSDIEAIDDYTVRFKLKAPQGSFLNNLSVAGMLVCPKHLLEKGALADSIVGSGPYRLKEHVRGVSIEIERNPDYHKPDYPYLDGLKWFVIPDTNTATSYFLTGQLDLYEHIDSMEAERVRQEVEGTESKVVEQMGLGSDVVYFNARQAPFDDIRVRTAISYAMDRDEGLRVVKGDAGIVSGLFPPGPWQLPQERLQVIPGYGPDKEANRAKALELLAEAGFPNGFETTIRFRNQQASADAATWVQSQLAKVGITASLISMELGALEDALRANTFDLVHTPRSVAANDPDAILSDFASCTGVRNYSGICADGFDEQLAIQASMQDVAERTELVHQLEEQALNNMQFVHFWYRSRFNGVGPRVQNFVLHSEPENNRRAEILWLKQ